MCVSETVEKQESHTLLVGVYTASIYKEGDLIKVTNAYTL